MEKNHMPGTIIIWPGVAEELVGSKARGVARNIAERDFSREALTGFADIVERRAEMGIPDSMIRLSVGIEDQEDLIEDFRQALS